MRPNCDPLGIELLEDRVVPATIGIDAATKTIHYTAEAGETNNVQIASTANGFTITDSGAKRIVVEPASAGLFRVVGKTVSFTGSFSALAVDAGDKDDRVDASRYTGAAPLTVTGGDGNDRIVGSPKADTLNGGTGADRIEAGAGNDTVNGDAGNDSLSGDAGNDTVNGGTGIDVLYGQAGDDILTDADAGTTFDGGAGANTINGAAPPPVVTTPDVTVTPAQLPLAVVTLAAALNNNLRIEDVTLANIPFGSFILNFIPVLKALIPTDLFRNGIDDILIRLQKGPGVDNGISLQTAQFLALNLLRQEAQKVFGIRF